MATAVKSSPRRWAFRNVKRPADRSFFENLGPGLITGAADDDPSGISTYAVAGASFGYGTLWTALLSFPMMAAMQLMSARLGAVTGHGLAHEVRLRYSRYVLWGTCALLAISNIVNLAADLGGMGDATSMVTGLNPLALTAAYAIVIIVLLFWSTYKQIARIFKWLTLALFAYVFSAFLARPDWKAVLAATLVPHFAFSRDSIGVLVAILGTTISPYLFFWQAAQECEERRAAGNTKKSKLARLRALHIDVITGMVYSNLIMYFIILTTGATLHAHGQTDISSAKQAAEALLPLAGRSAYLLFALGIVGTGMLGVPVLAGSCGYAFAEASAWKGTLDVPPRRAPQFYAVIGAAIAAGLALNFAHVNAVKMLFWAAIVNGVLAPPLILLVILLTSSRQVMGASVSSPWVRILGWVTLIVMSAAAIALFIV